MSGRVLQATTALLLASCQSQSSAQPEASKDRPFTVSEVASFDTPWAMAFLPGSGVPLTNMALLTEKEGKLWLVDVTNGRRTAVSGVPKVVDAGQGGLGDVMPHPDFAGNRRVYLSFAEGGPDGTSGAALGYGTLDLGNPSAPTLRDFKVIWRQSPKVSGDGHFSHRIAFGKPRTRILDPGADDIAGAHRPHAHRGSFGSELAGVGDQSDEYLRETCGVALQLHPFRNVHAQRLAPLVQQRLDQHTCVVHHVAEVDALAAKHGLKLER